MKDFTVFQEGAKKLGITLSERQLSQFYEYYEYLIEVNQVMNLTAITEYKDVIHKHFLDSLSLVLWKGFQGSEKMIDVGTGAGFPGIPLKIVFPELQVVLLDSLNKRVKFLNNVVDRIGLSGIMAVHARAEELGRNPEYREKFEICVSRAVANLSTLSEYAMPFVKSGGNFIAYKSGNIKEELENASRALDKLSADVQKVISFSIPGTDLDRTLVIIKKKKPLSPKYPRKSGLPAKEPL